MFKYNENKQAYIDDLRAGTYRQMVEAAESLPGVDHPPGQAVESERARAGRTAAARRGVQVAQAGTPPPAPLTRGGAVASGSRRAWPSRGAALPAPAQPRFSVPALTRIRVGGSRRATMAGPWSRRRTCRCPTRTRAPRREVCAALGVDRPPRARRRGGPGAARPIRSQRHHPDAAGPALAQVPRAVRKPAGAAAARRGRRVVRRVGDRARRQRAARGADDPRDRRAQRRARLRAGGARGEGRGGPAADVGRDGAGRCATASASPSRPPTSCPATSCWSRKA